MGSIVVTGASAARAVNGCNQGRSGEYTAIMAGRPGLTLTLPLSYNLNPDYNPFPEPYSSLFLSCEIVSGLSSSRFDPFWLGFGMGLWLGLGVGVIVMGLLLGLGLRLHAYPSLQNVNKNIVIDNTQTSHTVYIYKRNNEYSQQPSPSRAM